MEEPMLIERIERGGRKLYEITTINLYVEGLGSNLLAYRFITVRGLSEEQQTKRTLWL
jgi:hypothetical protein